MAVHPVFSGLVLSLDELVLHLLVLDFMALSSSDNLGGCKELGHSLVHLFTCKTGHALMKCWHCPPPTVVCNIARKVALGAIRSLSLKTLAC